jgi:transcriptional regulator GlxA family with amidase domain
MADPIVTRLGVVVFRGFALLDVAGPLQFFNQLSSIKPFQLSIIAKTMDPVSTIPPDHLQNSGSSNLQPIGESWLPTHTFENAPELDILLVPGGYGTRDETIFNEVTAFLKERYPGLKYLLSVCTGAAMVAAAGILDGRKATSNKFSWSFATRHAAVHWVPKARWVVDGNIWSSSGVAAGMDMTYAFIASQFSPDIAKKLANTMEYEPHTDPNWDPFSDLWATCSK